jgi:hypothetical protein
MSQVADIAAARPRAMAGTVNQRALLIDFFLCVLRELRGFFFVTREPLAPSPYAQPEVLPQLLHL